MRMDDAVLIGKIEVAELTQGDFDASTRILCQLTSDEREPEVPWQTDVPAAVRPCNRAWLA